MQDLYRAKIILAERKKAAEKKYSDTLEKLQSDEAFATLYSRVSLLKFELARREVFAIPVEEELQKEFAEKSDSLAKLLKKAGIDETNRPIYACPICSDTGYAKGKMCECLKKLRIEVNLSDYKFLRDLPKNIGEINFSFYGEYSEKYAKLAKFLDIAFLNGSVNFCTLVGAAGTGKTYFSQVLAKQLLLDGKSIKIINSITLNRKFLEYHCAPLNEKNSLWSEIADYDLLIIDDLGVESILNNVTLQYIYELLTERIDKKTLITTNLTLPALEDRYGQRIFSRLSDKSRSAIVGVEGKDYRR